MAIIRIIIVNIPWKLYIKNIKSNLWELTQSCFWQEQFYKIEHDYVVNTAKLAKEQGYNPSVHIFIART